MKMWIGLLFIGLSGCASFEPLPDRCKMESLDGFDKMVCEDVPPEAKAGQVCDKLANNMYYCHKPI